MDELPDVAVVALNPHLIQGAAGPSADIADAWRSHHELADSTSHGAKRTLQVSQPARLGTVYPVKIPRSL